MKCCPICNDTAVLELFSSLECCTKWCQNYSARQEEDYLENRAHYFVLCFCDECIFCNGQRINIGKFRMNNINYSFSYVHLIFPGGDIVHKFILVQYGNSTKESYASSIDILESHPGLLSQDEYEPLHFAYKLFKEKLRDDPNILDSLLLNESNE